MFACFQPVALRLPLSVVAAVSAALVTAQLKYARRAAAPRSLSVAYAFGLVLGTPYISYPSPDHPPALTLAPDLSLEYLLTI
jgi:hypothetical protein